MPTHFHPHNQAKALTLQNPLYRQWVLQFTARELEKDLGRGDITAETLFKKSNRPSRSEDERSSSLTRRRHVGATLNLKTFIVAKEAGILAGRQEIEFFLKNRLRVKFLKKDGSKIRAGDTIALLAGDIREILKVERAVLNLLGRMGGVATTAARIVAKAKKINPRILVAPTRKTLWGLLDKRACSLGGAGTHRLGLDNAVLIKDNHLDALGRNIPKAIGSFFPKPAGRAPKAAFFEIEVETPAEAKIACATLQKLQKAGLGRLPCFVMLDNFSPKQIQKTLEILRAANLRSCAKIEASGGINETNISAYAKTGVDIISMGSLTHSAPMLDLSLVMSE